MPSARLRRTLRRSWDFVTTKCSFHDAVVSLTTRGRIVPIPPSRCARRGAARSGAGFERCPKTGFRADQCYRIGSPSPIAQDAPDALEPRRHVALRTELLRLIVSAAAQLVGQVLLREDARVAVMRIAVALAVPEPFRTGVV